MNLELQFLESFDTKYLRLKNQQHIKSILISWSFPCLVFSLFGSLHIIMNYLTKASENKLLYAIESIRLMVMISLKAADKDLTTGIQLSKDHFWLE